MAEPQYDFVDFLRRVLTDYNATARIGGEWIYPDQPLIRKLNFNSFPRIGVELLSESADLAGADAQDWIGRAVLRITIYDKHRREPLDHPSLPSKRANIHLLHTIVRDILDNLRQKWQTDPSLKNYYDYNVRTIRPLPFDDERGIWAIELEIELLGANIGL